jgi:hypothetical protein
MRPHWPAVLSLFGDLAYLIKKEKLDPDGSELYFTVSDEWKRKKDTTDLKDMVSARAKHLGNNSNPARRLDWHLKKYEEELEEYENSRSRVVSFSKPVRPKNIYIFTDGVWQPGETCLDRIKRPIKRLVDTLEAVRAPDDQIGLQFIQFGNDEVGTRRMVILDEQLGLKRSV